MLCRQRIQKSVNQELLIQISGLIRMMFRVQSMAVKNSAGANDKQGNKAKTNGNVVTNSPLHTQ